MSLIITKNFKRAKAQDAAARDSIADKEREYTRLYELAQKNITFHAAKGDSAKVAEWKRKADEYKRLAQEAENAAEARNAKDSAATDAKFKIGDRVRLAGTASPALGKTGVVVKVDGEWGDVTVKTDEGKTYQYEASAVQKVANSRAADASGTDAKFQKGDIVKINPSSLLMTLYGPKRLEWRGRVVGYGVSYEHPHEHPVIEWERPCTFGREPIHERHIVKANDTANDSAAKFRVGQEVIVKTKYAEPYKARIVGLWDMSQNGPYDEQGYLVKNIKGGGVESMPEHALSLITA